MDLGSLDGAILVLAHGLFEHLGERTRLNHVLLHAGLDFIVDQLLQQFDGQVTLGKVLYVRKELVRQD